MSSPALWSGTLAVLHVCGLSDALDRCGSIRMILGDSAAVGREPMLVVASLSRGGVLIFR